MDSPVRWYQRFENPNQAFASFESDVLNATDIDQALLLSSRAVGNHEKGSDIGITIRFNNKHMISKLSTPPNQKAPIPTLLMY